MSETKELNRFKEAVEAGDYPELEGQPLVIHKKVCHGCRGSGTTWLGRPASDAVSFTQSEWGELDYDERDRWMDGTYDSTCPECNGKNVIDVLDEVRSGDLLVREFNRWMMDYYEYQDEIAAERATGC